MITTNKKLFGIEKEKLEILEIYISQPKTNALIVKDSQIMMMKMKKLWIMLQICIELLVLMELVRKTIEIVIKIKNFRCFGIQPRY